MTPSHFLETEPNQMVSGRPLPLQAVMPGNANDGRPGLAVITNCIAPYTVYLHRELATRIPELKLHTLVTHGPAEFDWKLELPESIHAIHFGSSNDSPLASTFRRPFAELRKGARIIRYLHQHDIRAVIVNQYRYLSYLRTIRHCLRAGIPLFVRNDSNIRGERDISRLKQFLKYRVYDWWVPRATGVMSMGEYGDQFFLKYGANPHRLYRVPCLPEYELYAHCSPIRLSEFRQRFGLQPNRKYLLFSGRLAPEKRVDLLVRAFAAIAHERPVWDMLIVGDGALRESLQKLAQTLCPQRVIWTGFLEQSECPIAYHAAHALVLPSDRDAWALVVQEAIIAGLPVISSDAVGAPREMVEDRVNGRIFAAGDLHGLEQAILDVTNPDTFEAYQRYSKDSYAKWLSKNDPIDGARKALSDCGVLPSQSVSSIR